MKSIVLACLLMLMATVACTNGKGFLFLIKYKGYPYFSYFSCLFNKNTFLDMKIYSISTQCAKYKSFKSKNKLKKTQSFMLKTGKRDCNKRNCNKSNEIPNFFFELKITI